VHWHLYSRFDFAGGVDTGKHNTNRTCGREIVEYIVKMNYSGQPIWATNTYGNPGAYYTMQDDGNFVIRSSDGKQLWATNTYGNPGAYYIMQDDGNFVIKSSDEKPLWASGTYGNPGAYYIMQADGNFVIHN